VSVANDQVGPVIAAALSQSPVEVTAYAGKYAELVQAADLVLVASGTTTLQYPLILLLLTTGT